MARLSRALWGHLHESDERGQTLVEYGLLLTFLVIVVFVALVFLGPLVSVIFQDVGSTLA